MTASANLAKLAKEIHNLPHTAMVTFAKQAKAIAEAEGRKAGSPLKGGRKPIKLTAYTDIKTSGDLTIVTMQGVPVGPWVWRTTGTTAHSIPRKRGSAKTRYLHARRYEHPIKTPPLLDHPGGHGAGAWEKVKKRVREEVPKVFVEELHKAVT